MPNIPKPITYKYVEVENHEESARNLSAVSNLIKSRDYDKAKEILTGMQGRKQSDNDLASLISLMESRQYSKALELAIGVQNKYVGLVKRVGGGKDGNLKTVMTVDDRPEILTSVNAALTGHYKVLGAPGGKPALQIMKRQHIDLFILDIEMPEMDGFTLTNQIRAVEKYEHTPIMFLTSNSSRECIFKSLQLGVIDFIVKPAYSEILLAKVGKYLS
jgi:CheY-like chemotaxis protein